jgi:ABC-type Na+ efflux pump permease subunit
VAWLQEYSWTARLTKWGWCLLLLVAEFVVFLDWSEPTIRTWQPILTMAIALGIAFSAANSFRRERQTGLLEIMLVTPLSVRRLIGGRLWGIFCHYFPALAVLTVCWIGYHLLENRPYDFGLLPLVVPNPVAFAALMLVGLYVSLTRLNLLLAWALAWAGAFILPVLITLALSRFAGMGTAMSLVLISLLQLSLMTIAWVLLDRAMRQRTFTLAAIGAVC